MWNISTPSWWFANISWTLKFFEDGSSNPPVWHTRFRLWVVPASGRVSLPLLLPACYHFQNPFHYGNQQRPLSLQLTCWKWQWFDKKLDDTMLTYCRFFDRHSEVEIGNWVKDARCHRMFQKFCRCCLQLTYVLKVGDNAAEASPQRDKMAPIILSVTASKVSITLLDAFGQAVLLTCERKSPSKPQQSPMITLNHTGAYLPLVSEVGTNHCLFLYLVHFSWL